MAGTLVWKIDLRPLAIARVRAACASALSDAAEHILEEANRTVPIEEGVRARSGNPDGDAGAGAAPVSHAAPCAARQHEETGWAHDPGRRAKWLELTLNERTADVRRFFATRLGSVLR